MEVWGCRVERQGMGRWLGSCERACMPRAKARRRAGSGQPAWEGSRSRRDGAAVRGAATYHHTPGGRHCQVGSLPTHIHHPLPTHPHTHTHTHIHNPPTYTTHPTCSRTAPSAPGRRAAASRGVAWRTSVRPPGLRGGACRECVCVCVGGCKVRPLGTCVCVCVCVGGGGVTVMIR